MISDASTEPQADEHKHHSAPEIASNCESAAARSAQASTAAAQHSNNFTMQPQRQISTCICYVSMPVATCPLLILIQEYIMYKEMTMAPAINACHCSTIFI